MHSILSFVPVSKVDFFFAGKQTGADTLSPVEETGPCFVAFRFVPRRLFILSSELLDSYEYEE